MPVYEYRCQQCDNRFEQLRRMADAEKPTECPECHAKEAELLISAFATGGCTASGNGGFT